MELEVRTGRVGYSIVVQRGTLAHAGNLLDLDRKVLVVTDSGVPQEYSDSILSACPRGSRFVFPAGEASKNMEVFSGILSELVHRGFTRTDAVVAVGGGVVGDISGFAAACYMRGIDYYNVPTTLLSQVDSSVGGKTAIDFEGVKNVVGAFHHPRKVIIDPDTLRTLDPRLLHEGLVEALKMGATSDGDLFSLIESAPALEPVLEDIIYGAVKIKAGVVSEDPSEKGLRRVLNFGHTVGHAVESAAAGALYHGECVGIGMMYMSEGEARDRIRAVLERYGLPVMDGFGKAELMSRIMLDKKKTADRITTVQVDRIGSFEFRPLTMPQMEECIDSCKLSMKK